MASEDQLKKHQLIFKAAEHFYGLKNNYKNRDRILKLVPLAEQISKLDYDYDDVKEGIIEACQNFNDEGRHYMPPAIYIINTIKKIASRRKEETRHTGGHLKEANEQDKRREQFKKDFYDCVEEETAIKIITEYCWKCDYDPKSSFMRNTFFGDFFCQDSVAKSILKDYGIEIRKRSGEVYS